MKQFFKHILFFLLPVKLVNVAIAESSMSVEVLQPKVKEIAIEQREEFVPQGTIEAFLYRYKVQKLHDKTIWPVILKGENERLNLAGGDIVYSTPVPTGSRKMGIYRPTQILLDPVSGEKLGQEFAYLGSVRVLRNGDPAKLRIEKTTGEVVSGDLLSPTQMPVITLYQPLETKKKIRARIIKIPGGVSVAGHASTLLINKGSDDGLKVGHIMRLVRNHSNYNEFKRDNAIELGPLNEVYGQAFVYQVYDRVAYVLVTKSSFPVDLVDYLITR